MLIGSYKVLIPPQIMDTAMSDKDKEEKVIKYLQKAYPERYLIEIKYNYAICGLK